METNIPTDAAAELLFLAGMSMGTAYGPNGSSSYIYSVPYAVREH